MKQFTKTLIAAALLAGTAGAANASIATGASAEAFFMAYDSTNGKTFDLDLGSNANLVALTGSFTSKLALNYNLKTDANWTSFQTGLDAANTKFGIVVGSGVKSFYTSATPSVFTTATGVVTSGLTTTSLQVTNGSNNDKAAAGRINIGAVSNTALNVSKLVLDTDTSGTGQWAAATGSPSTLANLWGAYSGANAAIDYNAAGAAANFFSTSGSSVKLLGQWTLTDSSLAYQGGAPVPLPAAVWMFGAGLMGVLRLNRRKSMAV